MSRSVALVLALGLALAPAALADDAAGPAYRYVPAGTPVEFKGKKEVGIWDNGRYLQQAGNEVRAYDGATKGGTKICLVREVKDGMILTWEDPGPDKFKNAIEKFVFFFLSDAQKNAGPQHMQDAKLYAQAFGNSMFALEIDATRPDAPKQVVDFNVPFGWKRVYGFAVYSNFEWRPVWVKPKDGSWKGMKEGDWDKNAILLPENYDIAGA